MSSELLYQEFGNNLRRARKDAGLTQEILAKRVNLSRTSITNIEKGRQHVTLHVLFLLANALGIDPSHLLPDINHLEEIEQSTARLLEKANLTNDVKLWVGKGLASISKKEKSNE